MASIDKVQHSLYYGCCFAMGVTLRWEVLHDHSNQGTSASDQCAVVCNTPTTKGRLASCIRWAEACSSSRVSAPFIRIPGFYNIVSAKTSGAEELDGVATADAIATRCAEVEIWGRLTPLRAEPKLGPHLSGMFHGLRGDKRP